MMNVPGTIGRYPVTGVIGTGAFSAVYRAIDERLGSEVAIKLLGDHHSLDPDIRERFIAEARLLRRVNSPHVVQLYELDETDRHQPYLVLELVPGGNLSTHRRLMAGRGLTVTPADVTTVAAAVTEALTALHGERIVHRDLSPSNLLLRQGRGAEPTTDGLIAPDEQLVLADLGLSKDMATSSGLTAAAGTDGFAAPEQRAGGTVDERTDVYAASALLTWFVLGHQPGENDASELAAGGWPVQLGDVLAAGLADHPDDRPPSIAEWHAAVATALEPPAPPPVPEDVLTDRPRPPRRRALAGAAVAAVLAGGAGYAAAVVVTDDDAPGPTITDLDEDTVGVEQSSGGVTAAFEGPARLVVGEQATFRADVEGAATFTWHGPDGQQVTNIQALAVTPRSPGRLVVSLVATARSGEVVVASRTITVEPAVDAAVATTDG